MSRLRLCCLCFNLSMISLSRSVLNWQCLGLMAGRWSSDGAFSLILDRVRGSLHVFFPGQGVGLGFFYAYRRSNTRTCHSMGSADLASVSFENFRCFDGVGRIPVRQLHTPGDGHLVCVGQTISKTRGPQILLMDICVLGPPTFWPQKSCWFYTGFLIVLVIVVTFIVGPPPTLRFSGNVDFAMVLE